MSDAAHTTLTNINASTRDKYSINLAKDDGSVCLWFVVAKNKTEQQQVREKSESLIMAEALRLNCEAMENNRNHILRLENRLLNGLNCEGIEYRRNGAAPFLPGLLSLAFKGFSGEAILHRIFSAKDGT